MRVEQGFAVFALDALDGTGCSVVHVMDWRATHSNEAAALEEAERFAEDDPSGNYFVLPVTWVHKKD